MENGGEMYQNIQWQIYVIVMVLFFGGCEPAKKDILTWTAINVSPNIQQGDAHLISKNGKYFLIDAGHISYAREVLLPFLKKKGVSELEAVLITHPHNDHYGGVKALIENHFKIKSLYMNMPTKEQMDKEYWGGTYNELLTIRDLAKTHHIKIMPIKKGDKLIFDKKSFIEVLYVYDGLHSPVGKTDINGMSVIAMIYDRNNKFLLTGDLNKKLGKYLGENADNIEADILKAPHHGTEGFAPNVFFETVNPKVLIVPSPKHLWFSKRSERTRALAKKYHYQTYVNGYHGDITVISNGDSYTIHTQRKIEDIFRK